MEHDRNDSDCTETIEFPKKIDNRPGLSRINYCIGTYSDFRTAMLHNLNNTDALTAWTYRGSDDPGIALLEGASIISHILCFYQDVYFNNTKLRTATWRDSIADLTRLVGYRLSPGLAGKATFAVQLRGIKPVQIPAGLSFKAEIEGFKGQQPVQFESKQDKVAYPWIGQFYLYRPLQQPDITPDTFEFHVSSGTSLDPSSETSLKEGDLLLMGDSDPDHSGLKNAEIVVVKGVRKQHGLTLFEIKGGLQKRSGSFSRVSEMVGFKLGRSFHHFGYNSPRKVVSITSGGTATETRISYVRLTSENTRDGLWVWTYDMPDDRAPKQWNLGQIVIDPGIDKHDVILDSEVKDLSPGTLFLIIAKRMLAMNLVEGYPYAIQIDTEDENSEYAFLRTLQMTRLSSSTWGAISGPATVTTLNGEELTLHGKYHFNAVDIRDLEFFEIVSPNLILKAAPVEVARQKGTELYFNGTADQAKIMKGLTIYFVPHEQDAFSAVVLSSNSSTSFDPSLHGLTLDKEVDYADFSNSNPSTLVFGNLIDTTQGKTENDTVLGNGDSRQRFQTFKLPKSPLTYLNIADEDPSQAPELKIYVNDRLWKRAASFLGRGKEEEIYIVREDFNGDSWVQFGDGQTGGSRLPSGIHNVVARFRTGIGVYGNKKPDTVVQSGRRIENLDKIDLLGVASGGSEPEREEHAKEAAPGITQSLGRLVSIKDFESEASSIAGVSKASARWDLEGNVPIIVITVLMESGREKELANVRDVISRYDLNRGMQRFSISVHQFKVKYVYLSLNYAYDATYRRELVEGAIKQSLGVRHEDNTHPLKGLFGINQRNFEEQEYSTRIEGIAQSVDGVLWVKVTALGILGEAEDPLTLVVPQQKVLLPVVSPGRDGLLGLHTKHLELNGSSAQSTGGRKLG